nr:MAG TPA: hypothetical protein [Caudoviricetes sp.]
MQIHIFHLLSTACITLYSCANRSRGLSFCFLIMLIKHK